MVKKNTLFDFGGNVLMIYGVTMLILPVFCLLFGADAKEYSTIFYLGEEGLSVVTMLQFFLMAILITAFKWIFFTDLLIKRWPLILRTIVMFALVIVTVGIFTAVFRWFPVNMPEAWIAFLISFLICAFVGVGISSAKEKSENKKLQEALEQLKRGEV